MQNYTQNHQTHTTTLYLPHATNTTSYRTFHIISQDEFYRTIAKQTTTPRTKYTKYLTDRGYNEKMVSNSFKKAEEIDRQQLYAKKTESTKKRCMPLVTHDNPTLPPMTNIINKNKNVLSLDQQLIEIVPRESIFVSYPSTEEHQRPTN